MINKQELSLEFGIRLLAYLTSTIISLNLINLIKNFNDLTYQKTNAILDTYQIKYDIKLQRFQQLLKLIAFSYIFTALALFISYSILIIKEVSQVASHEYFSVLAYFMLIRPSDLIITIVTMTVCCLQIKLINKYQEYIQLGLIQHSQFHPIINLKKCSALKSKAKNEKEKQQSQPSYVQDLTQWLNNEQKTQGFQV
ncbi:UNKNOWN [Stylonychia lemnae]|uniref:Transmembrane protein n=1 Tax=Stylonychia lemnae TaxID=5949 RepID=A0A078A1K5_STYLE|nr:UNKNOWN [Stylonychia lemnae]|eukprot:CDW75328.1 UNKNOWN [Stylonychia lemnae]